MAVLERPEAPASPSALLQAVDRHTLVNGFIAFLFAITGPLVILLAVATDGGLSDREIGSWIFGSYALNGLVSIAFSMAYRQPLGLAWTIPGAVLVGPALGHLSFAEVVGAYLATGLLITVLGLTGWVRRVMDAIPLPIVMAMVAGVFLPIGLRIVTSFRDDGLLASVVVAAFVAVSAVGRLARLLPPVLVALAAGALVLGARGGLAVESASLELVRPLLIVPEFSLAAMAELVIPLTVTVVVVQNGQGFFVLKSAGYAPPQNALTVGCGVASLAFGAVGTVPTCVTGPANAILNSSGDPQGRFAGGVVFGLWMLLFGLFAPLTVAVGLALPTAYIGLLGGLALLGVLQGAFGAAFGGRFTMGALVTFLVTLSDLTLFNIGPAFWGLVAGFAVSALLERGDFRTAQAA